MKKSLALVLGLCVAASVLLTACGEKKEETPATEAAVETVVETEAAETEAAETEAAETEAAETEAAETEAAETEEVTE